MKTDNAEFKASNIKLRSLTTVSECVKALNNMINVWDNIYGVREYVNGVMNPCNITTMKKMDSILSKMEKLTKETS